MHATVILPAGPRAVSLRQPRPHLLDRRPVCGPARVGRTGTSAAVEARDELCRGRRLRVGAHAEGALHDDAHLHLPHSLTTKGFDEKLATLGATRTCTCPTRAQWCHRSGHAYQVALKKPKHQEQRCGDH